MSSSIVPIVYVRWMEAMAFCQMWKEVRPGCAAVDFNGGGDGGGGAVEEDGGVIRF